MLVWTLGVWGELACHKRSLTHRPSSQGWASSVLLLCVCVSLFGQGEGRFIKILWLVCYTHVFPCVYIPVTVTSPSLSHVHIIIIYIQYTH